MLNDNRTAGCFHLQWTRRSCVRPARAGGATVCAVRAAALSADLRPAALPRAAAGGAVRSVLRFALRAAIGYPDALDEFHYILQNVETILSNEVLFIVFDLVTVSNKDKMICFSTKFSKESSRSKFTPRPGFAPQMKAQLPQPGQQQQAFAPAMQMPAQQVCALLEIFWRRHC